MGNPICGSVSVSLPFSMSGSEGSPGSLTTIFTLGQPLGAAAGLQRIFLFLPPVLWECWDYSCALVDLLTSGF